MQDKLYHTKYNPLWAFIFNFMFVLTHKKKSLGQQIVIDTFTNSEIPNIQNIKDDGVRKTQQFLF